MFKDKKWQFVGLMKSNLARIGQKIQENEYEKEGPFRITDMIRCKIVVENGEEMIEVIKMVDDHKDLEIIKVQNKLRS